MRVEGATRVSFHDAKDELGEREARLEAAMLAEDGDAGRVAKGVHILWIPGRLPGLNEIITAKRTKLKRGKGDLYSAMKARYGGAVKLLAQSAQIPELEAVHLFYVFVEPNRMRDPSNFVGGGMKIIEDGLQDAGVLANDGWKQILSFEARWFSRVERPGVGVYLSAAKKTLNELSLIHKF